jgi:DNA repair protein RecO (recombination protein O)
MVFRTLLYPDGERSPGLGPEACRVGLRLTGHLLARDVFGLRHRPLPQARQMLYDRVAGLTVEPGAADSETDDAG